VAGPDVRTRLAFVGCTLHDGGAYNGAMVRARARLVLAVALAGGGCATEGGPQLPADCATEHDAATGDGSSSGGAAGDTGVVMCDAEPVPACCNVAGDRWNTCTHEPAAGYAATCSCALQLGATQYGPACADALERYYTCLPTAVCMDVVLGAECSPEVSAIADTCPSLSPH
jgi:hypothetical protein